LEFTVLCAVRTGETIGATWPEIDLSTKVWTIPATRMKSGREHKIPLSDRALEILTALPREEGNPFVFVGPRRAGLSDMAMSAVLARMGVKDRATTHGFRSSFRTWASETTNYPHEVCEAALAHIVGDAVVRSYRRTDFFDRRRTLSNAWSTFCSSPATDTTGTVVPMRAG
jgi:integrase